MLLSTKKAYDIKTDKTIQNYKRILHSILLYLETWITSRM